MSPICVQSRLSHTEVTALPEKFMLHFSSLYKSFFSIVTTIKSKKKEKEREREAVCKCTGRKIEQELMLTWKQVISDFLLFI